MFVHDFVDVVALFSDFVQVTTMTLGIDLTLFNEVAVFLAISYGRFDFFDYFNVWSSCEVPANRVEMALVFEVYVRVDVRGSVFGTNLFSNNDIACFVGIPITYCVILCLIPIVNGYLEVPELLTGIVR